jgi:uncharacterized membrane protein
MNIHPAFVHFPIALLCLYVLMELIRTRKSVASEAYANFKALLVIVGTISVYFTLQTGEMAAELTRTDKSILPILRTHAQYADWTSKIFTLIALSYAVVLISKYWKNKNKLQSLFSHKYFMKVWSVIEVVTRFVQKPYIIVILALAGLVFLVITGALGGLMVYGPNADPFVHFVSQLFFGSK